jgi:hypothetical protein
LVDPAPLLRRIEDGYYRLVALDRQAPTPVAREVYRSVERGPYRRVWRGEPWNGMTVYVPRE